MSIYILTPEIFVKNKARQLVYVVNQLINQAIKYEEVHLILWDILEEWAALNKNNEQKVSDFESVFWYLFFIIQFEDEKDLTQNKQVHSKIIQCCNYLSAPTSTVPQGCIGIRP